MKNPSITYSTATIIITLIINLMISTQSIAKNVNKKEVAFNNKLNVIFDSHFYYNFEFSIDAVKNNKKLVSKEDHKSIESKFIATLNVKKTFSFGKEKENVSLIIQKDKGGEYILDFAITYIIDGKKIKFTPRVMVKINETNSIKVIENNSRFELNINISK